MSGIWPETLKEEVAVEALNKARPFVAKILGTKKANDVEDILNDAMIQAATHYHQFRGDASFSTWFVTIARNFAHMYVRSVHGYRHERVFVNSEILDYRQALEPSPEQQAIRSELFAILYDASKTLSRARHLAFVDAMNEVPTKENSASKARRHHMRNSLKEQLARRGVARCFA